MLVGEVPQTLSDLHRTDAGCAFLQNALSALRRSAQSSRNRDNRKNLAVVRTTAPLAEIMKKAPKNFYAKVDDISYNKKVYPVIAGQVGIGCCKRTDGRMRPEKFYRRLVLSLPTVSNADGWKDDVFLQLKRKSSIKVKN